MPRLPACCLLLLIGVAPVLAGQPVPIEVGLTTHLGDRQSFVDGDRISFLLSLERDAYVYLFYRDADKNLLQLLPNRRMPDQFFTAGLFMPVPNADQPFQFTVSPPYGDESLFALASDVGGLEFAGDELANGLILMERDIERLSADIRQASEVSFGRAELELKTLARGRIN